MAATHGIKWRDVKASDVLGTGPKGQSVDQTLDAVTVAGYASDGLTLTKSTIPVSSVGTGSTGSVGGVFGPGSIYGQVPRGPVDGVNRIFGLDYTLGSPFTWLSLNGITQKPPRDGRNANPDPDYAINGTTLTYKFAPKATDVYHYIWYIIDQQASSITPGTTAGATAYLVSAHHPNPASSQWGGGAGFNDTISLFTPHPSWLEDPSDWDKRTDTHTLSSGELTALENGTLFLLLEQFHVGSGAGDYDPPDQFWIYDAYILVALSDGSTQVWRPTSHSETGDVFNPENALDGDDTTYAILNVGGYFSGSDGAFLNLGAFQNAGTSVDVANGGGNPSPSGSSGGTGGTSSADQIAADMTGPSEGVPAGWPYSTDPVSSSLPSGSNALEWWSVLYVDNAGSSATNTRIAVRNVQMWWYNTATTAWVNGFGPTNVFDGGLYNGDYSGTELGAISFSTETDGSRSYGPPPSGKVDHCYAPYPRVAITPANFGGVVVLAEAKLVLINPAGTDDRSSANLLFSVGADPYPNTTGAGIDNNPGLVAGKEKYVTSSWRSFAATTMSQSALEATPPPIDLTGIDP